MEIKMKCVEVTNEGIGNFLSDDDKVKLVGIQDGDGLKCKVDEKYILTLFETT